MKYFECNLDENALYLMGEVRTAYQKAVAAVKERTDKLNTALELSGLSPATFHLYSSKLFKETQSNFDVLTPRQISDYCLMQYELHMGEEGEDRMEWPGAVVLFDTAFTTVKEWESLRHIGIGGSESSVVMGCNSHSSLRRLYHDKVGTPYKTNPPTSSVAMERGHFMEDRVIDNFCQKYHARRIPESRMFRSREYPACTANIDAIVEKGGELFVFEAKTSVNDNVKNWLGDKVPQNYVTQCHQYPAVLNDDRIKGTWISCMFTVDYSDGSLFLGATENPNATQTKEITRDIVTEKEILKAEQDFWDSYIESGVEPEKGSPETEAELLKLLIGPVDPEKKVQELSATLLDLIDRWNIVEAESKAASENKKQIDGKKLDLKNQFLVELGNAPEGRIYIGDGEYWQVTNKPPMVSEKINMEELRLNYPDAYNACVIPAHPDLESPRFAIRKKKEKKN